MSNLNLLLLRHTRLRAKIFNQGQNDGHRYIQPIAKNQAVFHLIMQDQCRITLEGEESSHILQEGDMLFIARGVEHVIQSIDIEHRETKSLQKSNLGSGFHFDTTEILCGVFEYDEMIRNPLLEGLPSSIIVRADFHSNPNWMKHLVTLLVAEANHESVGSNILVEQLLDAFFTHIIRYHLSSTSVKTGIFAAYNDQALHKVLEAIYQTPERLWSLEDFTSISNLSRSAFFDRFTQTLNETPMTYLMHIRMEIAYRILKEEDRKILDVALSCGYKSEAAFGRAFKRLYNITPSDVHH